MSVAPMSQWMKRAMLRKKKEFGHKWVKGHAGYANAIWPKFRF